MSFVRLVRYCVCITLLLNAFVPQRALFGQSGGQTSTPTPTEQSSGNNSNGSLPQDMNALGQEELYEQLLDQQVDLYLANMSIDDKIGQLFVIAFEGNDIGTDSEVAELIHEYRIGGVVLSPRNRNFSNSKSISPEEAIVQVSKVVNGLQALSYGYEWDAQYEVEADEPSIQLTPIITRLAEFEDPPALPLFIAVEQAGDGQSKLGLPNTSLRKGFSELPSQLAIGATWNTDISRGIGSIVGKELSAVGFNMLLGPYLDVQREPRTGKAGSLGIYSFGGDPFWVSRMSRAYISGVHEGGKGRVLSIARNFPGQGDTDRLPFEEIATITSNLQTLSRIHLPPFTAVTSNISGTVAPPLTDPAITDGMMTSHMHFSGLQGDPVDGLTPFGFSSELLTTMEDYSEWRADGLMMTSELGAPAIRKNYTAVDGSFPFLGLTRDAFLAGHDLLYLSYYGSEDSADDEEKQTARENIIEVISLFRSQYDSTEDGAFRERVDQSVRRILKAKFRLYGADDTFFEKVKEAELAQLQMDAATVLTTTMTTPLSTTIGATETASITTSAETSVDTTAESVESTETVTAADRNTNEGELAPGSLLGLEAITATLSISVPLASVLISENPIVPFIGSSKESSTEIINQAAEESLTLLFPQLTGDLAQLQLPPQPQGDEKIVIITDNNLVQECEQCLPENLVNPQEIEKIIIQRYGENATQQIAESQIKSATFLELDTLLRRSAEESAETEESADAEEEAVAVTEPQTPSEIEADPESNDEDVTDSAGESEPTTEPSTLPDTEEVNLTEEDIQEADWIIFAMLDIVEERESSNVVQRFLNTRGEQLRDKWLIVLALNGPYFLDATEIRRLNAYYGVNSKIRPFLSTAVRTLFKDSSLQSIPPGSSPVSAPGTRFDDLAEQLLPDPDRSIPIEIWQDDVLIAQHPVEDDAESIEGTSISSERPLTLRVFDILDSNGNVVRDDTPVTFEIRSDDQTSLYPDETSPTTGGVAERIISLERLQPQGGTLTIFASIVVDVENNINAQSEPLSILVDAMAVPTTEPSENTTIIVEATPTEQVEASPTTAAGGDDVAANDEKRHVDWFTLLISLVTILGMVSLLVILQERILPRQYLVRNILWAIVVGLLVYVLYGLLLPVELGKLGYPWAPPLAVFVSMLIPLLWLQLRQDS